MRLRPYTDFDTDILRGNFLGQREKRKILKIIDCKIVSIIKADLTQQRTGRNSDILEEELCGVLTLQAQLVQLPPLVEAGRVGIHQEQRHSVGGSLL